MPFKTENENEIEIEIEIDLEIEGGRFGKNVTLVLNHCFWTYAMLRKF